MTNQHIFITGGASGIGAAAVRLFSNRGWKVTFSDINKELGNKLYEELGDGVLFVAADTRNREEIKTAIAAGIEKYGPFCSVFANAGIHRANTMLDISDEELKLMIDTNIYGTVHTLQAAVPHIIESGGGSVVINCSDQWFVGKPYSFGYGLTKGALGQITRSLSIDLGKHGIRVNAVCAGTIRTPLVDNLFDKFAKIEGKTIEDYWVSENSLYMRGEAGRPEEVAELVLFLASDAASFCTGGHYLADGGLVAQ